jgi:hypothetical protein
VKILALRTYSLSCNPILDPLTRLGHEVHEVSYHNYNLDNSSVHHAIPGMIAEQDLVVMLGQHDDGKGQVPPVEILAEIAVRVPFIHICCDGSETVWWPQLDTYKAAAPKITHINIDGVDDGFFQFNGWTTLCPMDHIPWEKHLLSWYSRVRGIAFCGGWGVHHPRGDDIDRLIGKKLVCAVKRPFEDYDGFRNFMGSHRAIYNHATTGTADHMHVKARVLETAFAGAVLLEPVDSPAARYFDYGDDFLTYHSDDDLASWGRILAREDCGLWRMADRFREKAIDLYSAERFWPKAFRLAGVA